MEVSVVYDYEGTLFSFSDLSKTEDDIKEEEFKLSIGLGSEKKQH